MKKAFIFKFKKEKLNMPDKLGHQIRLAVKRISNKYKVDNFLITTIGNDFADDTLRLVVNIKRNKIDVVCDDSVSMIQDIYNTDTTSGIKCICISKSYELAPTLQDCMNAANLQVEELFNKSPK